MKNNKKFLNFYSLLILLLFCSQLNAGGKWYNDYEDGIKLMEQEQWAAAILKFKNALTVKSNDTSKIKTYGMHFIEYYPHREIGICLYELKEHAKAEQQLQLSLRQSYSARAMEYLQKITGGTPVLPPLKPRIEQREEDVESIEPKPQKLDPKPVKPDLVTTPSAVKLVGERMGLAVLPFQTSGLGVDIGEINIVEQMMTTFYNTNRFKLVERTQLEKILAEQSLGMSGVLDASTAAEIGKGIGVDAIVLGNVTRAGNNLAIDARLIDTETAQIITAQDELSEGLTIAQLKSAIQSLAQKISVDLPLLEGYVIGISGTDLTIDIGSGKGIKKGMKCIIYSEGEDVVHPITKKILGKQTTELGEIKLTQVYVDYSVGIVLKSNGGIFEVGNKFVTK